MAEETLIKLEDLSIKLAVQDGYKYLIKHSEIELPAHKSIGLVGESGSGKTLTVGSILGILSFLPGITGGKLWLNYGGQMENVWSKAPWVNNDRQIEDSYNPKIYFKWQRKIAAKMKYYKGKKISIIFQRAKSSLNPFLKIRNQIFESMKIAGDDNNYNRMLDWLTGCGFARDEAKRVAELYPHQLSGGQAQRAIMAVVLSSGADTIIADEPTTGLDAKLQVETLVFMKKLLDQYQRSAIIVSHNLYSVAKFTDICYVMYRGLTVEKGLTSKIFQAKNNIHPYTQKLKEGVEKKGQLGQIVDTDIKGCPYYPNCQIYINLTDSRRSQCRENLPPRVNLDSDHFLRCWAFEK